MVKLLLAVAFFALATSASPFPREPEDLSDSPTTNILVGGKLSRLGKGRRLGKLRASRLGGGKLGGGKLSSLTGKHSHTLDGGVGGEKLASLGGGLGALLGGTGGGVGGDLTDVDNPNSGAPSYGGFSTTPAARKDEGPPGHDHPLSGGVGRNQNDGPPDNLHPSSSSMASGDMTLVRDRDIGGVVSTGENEQQQPSGHSHGGSMPKGSPKSTTTPGAGNAPTTAPSAGGTLPRSPGGLGAGLGGTSVPATPAGGPVSRAYEDINLPVQDPFAGLLGSPGGGSTSGASGGSLGSLLGSLGKSGGGSSGGGLGSALGGLGKGGSGGPGGLGGLSGGKGSGGLGGLLGGQTGGSPSTPSSGSSGMAGMTGM